MKLLSCSRLMSDPDGSLSELRWMTPEEEHLVVHEWNQTQADFPRDVCLHHLFEQQAALTPDAIAVSLGERALTYGELDVLATRLARRLRRPSLHESYVPRRLRCHRSPKPHLPGSPNPRA